MNRLDHTSRRERFASWILFVLLLLLTRQPQLPALSNLTLTLSIVALFLFLRARAEIVVLASFGIFLCFSALVAIVHGAEPASIARFAAILMLTPIAFCWSMRTQRLGLVSVPILLQCVLIVGLALFLAAAQNTFLASELRLFFLTSGWGDVYSFDGYYYRVQLKGNALIPLFYLVFLWTVDKGRSRKVLLLVTGVALIFAGNVTYLVVCGTATVVRLWGIITSRKIRLVLFILLLVVFVLSAQDLFNFLYLSKFQGGETSSFGMRYDQLATYLASISEHPYASIVGRGVGSCFPNSALVDYCDSLYIELQTLNILLQIGVAGLAAYSLVMYWLARRTLKPEGQVIFWLYIALSATNPYIFDINQLIATLVLVAFFGRAKNAARVQPRLVEIVTDGHGIEHRAKMNSRLGEV